MALQPRHWVARSPLGNGRRVPLACCAVEALARGAAQASFSQPSSWLRSPAHETGEALEVAVKADPSICSRAARMGVGTPGDADLLSWRISSG